MPWEHCLKGDYAFVLGRLNAPKHGVVEFAFVGCSVCVSRSNTTVDPLLELTMKIGMENVVAYGTVAVPHLQHHTGEGLAGVDIDDLHFVRQWNTRLLLHHVLTDEFSSHIYETLLSVRLFSAAHSQYGPSVTSGVRMQELFPANRTSAGV